jgi:hypothetical protein
MNLRIAALAAVPTWSQCEHIQLKPSTDYNWLTASGSPSYRLKVNDSSATPLLSPQSFLLHGEGDGSPLESSEILYQPGRFGSSFSLPPGGKLTFARQDSLDPREGGIEFWIAAKLDGGDPVYAQRDHPLFQYRAANGDTLSVTQSRSIGVLYGGGSVNGQWQSAYGNRASTRSWKAGEWHHVLFTWSASGNFMRFYIDGVLTADTNEKRFHAPADSGDRFSLGSDQYLLDEVRIFSRPLDTNEIRMLAARTAPPLAYEAWLPMSSFSPGDLISAESEGCPAIKFPYAGIPLFDATPPSTLLPPETTQLDFTIRTRAPAECRYSVNSLDAWDAMSPFSSGQGALEHHSVLLGISPNTLTVNEVRVRCDSAPDFELLQRYRSVPRANPRFPRTGNLWGTGQLRPLGLEHAARIEVWPGSYRLNLTKPYVAEFQARFAYQQIIDNDLLVDGCFFDNFFTSQSWQRTDIHGRAVQIDADEDGHPDDSAWLDREWKAGVYHELNMWRTLMPHALASGHLPRPPSTEFSTIFNGDSIGFLTADVLESKRPFNDLWAAYHDWWTLGRQPVVVMVESSPHDQIAYGYDYSPLQKIPPSTLEFARTYYPSVRFGLAFTLLNDGFFAHEFGDTWHGDDWWYDELDFDLGYPLGPARSVPVHGFSSTEHVDNGGFEQPLASSWTLSVNAAAAAAVSSSKSSPMAACSHPALSTNPPAATNGTNSRPSRSPAPPALSCGLETKAPAPPLPARFTSVPPGASTTAPPPLPSLSNPWTESSSANSLGYFAGVSGLCVFSHSWPSLVAKKSIHT